MISRKYLHILSTQTTKVSTPLYVRLKFNGGITMSKQHLLWRRTVSKEVHENHQKALLV